MYIYKENFFYDYVLKNHIEMIGKIIEKKHECYYNVKIPKKGGLRVLNCIRNDTPLYQLQTFLKINFLDKIPIAENVYGFVKEQSYKSFLLPHVWENNTERFYLRLDIKDFFGSITKDILSESFKYYFKTDEKKSKEMNNILTEILTLDNVLPQGAVTSPVASNIVFRKLDIRIQKYCKKLNFTYSRYADDLLFSSTNNRLHDEFFIKMISAILKSLNFKINTSKIKKSYSEIALNGFIVGKNIRISRSKMRDINRVLFIYRNKKPKNTNDFLNMLNSSKFKRRVNVDNKYFLHKTNLLNYLNGYRSFLISWKDDKSSSEEYKKSQAYIERLEKLILDINNMK